MFSMLLFLDIVSAPILKVDIDIFDQSCTRKANFTCFTLAVKFKPTIL